MTDFIVTERSLTAVINIRIQYNMCIGTEVQSGATAILVHIYVEKKPLDKLIVKHLKEKHFLGKMKRRVLPNGKRELITIPY